MNDPKIEITKKELLSNNWYLLNKYTFNYQTETENQTHVREVYDRGNGAAILLYNTTKKTVILTRQFRLPAFLNGNESGMMIECCAGLLEEENPEACIIRETEEETGYRVTKVNKVMQTFMSPGAVTEVLYLFIGEYNDTMKVNNGGGLESEQENIEVLEYSFDEAFNMIATGEIQDAKTVILLQHLKLQNIL